MLGLESLGGWTHAAAIIGIVLLEAIVLYVGYGAFESLLGPTIIDIVRGD